MSLKDCSKDVLETIKAPDDTVEKEVDSDDSEQNCEASVFFDKKRVVYQGTYPIDRPVSLATVSSKRQQMTLTLKTPRTYPIEEPIGCEEQVSAVNGHRLHGVVFLCSVFIVEPLMLSSYYFSPLGFIFLLRRKSCSHKVAIKWRN